MSLNHQPNLVWNKWFLLPFAIWLFVGGGLLLFYDKQFLFAQVNVHHSSFLDIFMFYATKMGEGVFGTIILLMLLAFDSFRNWGYFFAALACNLLPSLLTQLVKNLVSAPRPLNYFHSADWIHMANGWEKLYENSFPSGHTTAAFSLFAFLSFVFTARFQKLGFLFFLLAMMVAYSRMYLAAHFFLDVYVGSIIGVVFTMLIGWVMKNKSSIFLQSK